MGIQNIQPIQSAKTTWANASGKKKAAMVAGTLVGAAAIGATAYAIAKGKAPENAKGLTAIIEKLKDGYKQLGSKIAEKFNSAVDWVKSKLPKKAEDVAENAEKAADDAAEQAAKAADDVAEAAGETVEPAQWVDPE